MKTAFSLLEPRYIVDKTGKKIEVILDVKTYDQLIELLEDYSLGKMAQDVMATEKKEEYVDLDEIRKDFLKDATDE